MDNYKTNSYKSKNQPKKINKVISGKATINKKSGTKKLFNAFIAEDVSKIKDFIVMDVVIPTVIKAVHDICISTVEMLVPSNGNKVRRNEIPITNIRYGSRDYNSISKKENYVESIRNTYSFNDIVLDSRSEAELVISQMHDIIEEYGFVSVSDLYDLIGVTGNYTDNNYGWSNINDSSIVRVRNGYLIKFPKVLPIDNR